ncbi:Hypothetical predicted protein [Paramuricea clavata]|uniref:Uncharacterized protein n=1 Tax=Paramuricea clavata TaxID=317549 RepID=A0A7D9DVW0_PARCT|nr:Hypothetical predicted protein [Paramuricea clavata]
MDVLSYMKAEILQAAKAKEEKEWNDEENEIIIQFFKENEAMWNHNIPSYKDRNLREYNYQNLSEMLPSRSHDEIKKQWHVLKAIFSRELKREEGSKVSGRGTDSVYNLQWKLFNEMMFVKGSDNVDPSITSMTDPFSAIQPSKRLKAEKAREMEEMKISFYREAITCLKAPLPSLSVEHCSKAANDEISLYVKSVEGTLRKFSPRQLVFAKKRINV